MTNEKGGFEIIDYGFWIEGEDSRKRDFSPEPCSGKPAAVRPEQKEKTSALLRGSPSES